MTNIDDVPQQQGASDNFTGTTHIQPVASEEGSHELLLRKEHIPFGTNMVVSRYYIFSKVKAVYSLKGRE